MNVLTPGRSKLERYGMEISWGAQWIDLNDHEVYTVHADTGQQRAKSFRQIKTSSPIVEGDQLLHAVPDMVVEQIKVQVFGEDMVAFDDNMESLENLFGQFAFSIRQTKNNSRETWKCQMANAISIEAGHVYMHSMMGVLTASVPRYPTVSRERLDA